MKFAVYTKDMLIGTQKTVAIDRGFDAKLVPWFELKRLRSYSHGIVSVNQLDCADIENGCFRLLQRFSRKEVKIALYKSDTDKAKWIGIVSK